MPPVSNSHPARVLPGLLATESQSVDHSGAPQYLAPRQFIVTSELLLRQRNSSAKATIGEEFGTAHASMGVRGSRKEGRFVFSVWSCRVGGVVQLARERGRLTVRPARFVTAAATGMTSRPRPVATRAHAQGLTPRPHLSG